jgi:Zn finger protein HypA/HybF involved in hydrogenase expression
MSAHDRYLANRSSRPVHVLCKNCGQSWDDTYTEEYGAGWFEKHEDCPECGSTDLDSSELDEIDIQERRLEARGEDF